MTTPKKRGAGYKASRDERQRGPQADTRTKAIHAPFHPQFASSVWKGCIYVMKKRNWLCRYLGSYITGSGLVMVLPS